MLNFRNTNIIFITSMAVIVCSGILYHISYVYYVFPFFVYSLVVFWGCYNVGSDFFIKIVCAAKKGRKEIAISFDDGPAENYTPAILALLKKNKIEAVFFCIGKRIAGNEKILMQINAEGHIIGNHSFSHHLMFDMFSAKKMTEDLQMMDEETIKITGLKPRLFRPPYGVTNPNVRRAMINGNYTGVGWSIRSFDTVINDGQKLFKRVTASVKPGDIVLFHDTSKTTLDILQRFIDYMQMAGYTFVRLDKLLNIEPYA